MLLRYLALGSLFMCIVVTNCVGNEVSTPMIQFFKKHPELKEKYKELYPTSFEYVIMKTHLEFSRSLGVLRRLSKAFPGSPEVVEYAEKTIELIEQDQEHTMEIFEKLKDRFSKKDNYVYWFLYSDGKVHEAGYLVLDKQGEILFREAFTGT